MFRFATRESQVAALMTTAVVAPMAARAQSPEAPPVRLGSAAEAESLLVDLRAADSTIRVAVRYAGRDNFMGEPLPGYESATRAWLRREAAAALGRVQRRLATGGLGLLVWDGYRPVRASEAMVVWAERTGQQWMLDSGYVARRSRHNLGLAVDLTLVDLVSGYPLDLGTPYDTFDARAHTANATGRVRTLRRVLVRAMEAEGFVNYEREWWHFSFAVPDPVAFDVPSR